MIRHIVLFIAKNKTTSIESPTDSRAQPQGRSAR